MKTNLPSHINDWSFNAGKKENFLVKYDLFIIIIVFTIGYLVIF